MRTILFKIWKFPQLSETFVVNQIVLAIKLGYDVKILVEEICDIKKNSNQQLFDKYHLQEKIIPEDYKIPRTKSGRAIKTVGTIIKRPNLLTPLLKFYRNSERKGFFAIFQFFFYESLRNYDIIHIQFGTNKQPVDVLKKIGFLNGRLIISFHGHDLYFPINNSIPSKNYYNNLFEAGEFLICNTPFLEQKLLEIEAPKQKINIIPVVVDTQYFSPKPKNSSTKIKLITVGRLENFKGQVWGIKSIERLIRKKHNVEYIIAGNGSLLSKLQEKVKELGLNNVIKFTGAISQFEVRQLLQESDIFLMTSVTDPNYGVESQGLVTAEAQACGLPVVAFDTGGVKYTIKDGETGFLCKEKDVECFASKIEGLILNKDLRKKMSKNAIWFIENNFSENSVLEKWRSVYK